MVHDEYKGDADADDADIDNGADIGDNDADAFMNYGL